MFRSAWLWIALVLVACGVVGIVGWQAGWFGGRSGWEKVRTLSHAPPACSLAGLPYPSWSPDGHWIAVALVRAASDEGWLGVVNVDHPHKQKWLPVRRIQDESEDEESPGILGRAAWAGNGRDLVVEEWWRRPNWVPAPFQGGGRIAIWRVAEKRVRRVAVTDLGPLITVSPDSTLAALYSLVHGAVRFLPFDSKRQPPPSVAIKGALPPMPAAWAEGGQGLLALGGSGPKGEITLVSPGKTTYTVISTGRRMFNFRFVFDPQGKHIHFLDLGVSKSRGLLEQYFARISVPEGNREDLLAVSKLGIGENVTCPDWSTDCTQAVVVGKTDKGHGVYLIDLLHATAKRLTDGPDDRAPSISPDGKRVLFTRGGNSVWVMNIDGSDQHPILQLGSASTSTP